jgi:hypothetical protein
MKFTAALILTALLGFAAPLYFPWWSIAITSFIVAFTMQQKAWGAFITGFVGIFVLWALLAVVIDVKNEHLLSVKIANILPLGGSYTLLILIGSFEGALVAGCAAITGSLLREAMGKRMVKA